MWGQGCGQEESSSPAERVVYEGGEEGERERERKKKEDR